MERDNMKKAEAPNASASLMVKSNRNYGIDAVIIIPESVKLLAINSR